MKYKVGDKVRVRQWDDMVKEFGYLCKDDTIINMPVSYFTNHMRQYCGKVVTICKVYELNNAYAVCEDRYGYYWADDMFEPIEQPKPEVVHHSPLTYRIYDELKLHVGRANSISAEALSDMFGISQRQLRKHILTIRRSGELEKVIGSANGGYYVCTAEEVEKAINRLIHASKNMLKTASVMAKKAERNGQYKMKFGDYFKDVYESLGEVDE